MTLESLIKQHSVLPAKFTLKSGDQFETTTMEHSDGTWYAYLYKMKGNIRHLERWRAGDTESEAIENLKIALLIH